jgi:hypothetical protein
MKHDPLGIFHGARLLANAPDNWHAAWALRDDLADKHGVSRDTYEVLLICSNHPARSRVDCPDCVHPSYQED